MNSNEHYLGCEYSLDSLRSLNDRLNSKVVEQLNETQELVMLNNFEHESNEYLFRKCLQERISDIASWRWVFEDLTKRLEEAISSLEHEHNALRVVIQRLKDEINGHSKEDSKPGALCPLSDIVEEAIMQEFNFLQDEKKKFENKITELDKQIVGLRKTKKRIDVDILKKQKALDVEESCINVDLEFVSRISCEKKKKRRGSPISHWEHRCATLKKAGLKALTNAVIVRQQVRGARVHLSIAAQAYSARVDAALKRRLHANRAKLEDLKWQRAEAVKDYKSLEEELVTTEHNLIDIMDQERLTEARIADRAQRPVGELTKDDVDRKLRDDLARVRRFCNQLRTNYERITGLQNSVTESITHIDCCGSDLMQVINLDEERLQSRLGDQPETPSAPSLPSLDRKPSHPSDGSLMTIKEEDEDDYPFND
ncbi:hypothetical protein K1T71_011765 [Dendrolimus kikuchii]|uniref:Uncharacterized protein n=1 Tax=Dendrolimus kikuchii TaxID=765133 RepID=A0ACC1CMF8_9NEOP|nr:hypothetical protein K1T71_011765 [Dendrolimus kikuchii]